MVGVHVAAMWLVARPGASDSLWWAANLWDSFLHWCVPVFVMISGALWLGNGKPESAWDFYRRRARRLVWPLLGWSLIYLALAAFTDPHWSPARASVSVLRGAPWYHLWYLWMLPGLILLTPVLRHAVACLSRPQLWRLALLLCVLAALEVPLGWLRQTFLSSFLLHLGPFLLGHLLFTARPKTPACWLWAGALLCGLGVALGAGLLRPWLGARAIELMYAYPNPLVLGMGVCVFLLGLRCKAELLGTLGKTALAAAPLSFGIYLIHPLWLLLLMPAGMPGGGLHPALAIPQQSLLVFALSAGSTALLLRLPGLRRLVA